MSVNFATVVENVQSLSFNDKFELKELLDKYLIEERRDEIYQNYLLSQQEDIDNTVEFSSSMNQLEEMLND